MDAVSMETKQENDMIFQFIQTSKCEAHYIIFYNMYWGKIILYIYSI